MARVLRIEAFGGLTVHRGGQRVLGATAQPRRMALLAMVARAGTRGISRDELQATLWPDASAESGRNALKQAVYALRRDAEVGELFLGTRELRLNADEVGCDVTEFTDLLQRHQRKRAVQLYQGPFLHGFRLPAVPEFEDWLERERRHLERALAGALERLAQNAKEQGDPFAVVQWCRRLAALEPLNERLTIDLMNALLAAGDRPGALQQARIYEGLIAQQLDLPPHPGVVELARQIREGRVLPATLTPPPTRDSPVRDSPRAPASDVEQVAVAAFPFAPLAPDVDTESFADGLTEEMISALGRKDQLLIHGGLSRGDMPDLATLGLSALIEGSVRRSGEAVRVTARLLRVPGGALLWTESYDRVVANVLALQDELAQTIAGEVERALTRLGGRPGSADTRERARELYARGMRAWSTQGAGLGQGLEEFRQAIAFDPAHVGAHAAIAESYTQLAFYGFLPGARAAELADHAAREAMRLGPDQAESRLANGSCLLWVHRDFEAGTRELERALVIDPTLVAARARLAFVRLCHDGPMEAQRAVAERAATMTGATGLSRVMFGQQLLAGGRFDEAIEALHSAIDIEAPNFLAYHWLTMAYAQKRMGAEAVAAAVAEASLSDRHPWSLMSLVVACATAKQRRRAATLLESLTARAETSYVQASVLAQAHAALGDLETGMAFLERAVEEHDPSMMMVRTFPMFAPFRAHRRFRSLLRLAGWRDWDTAEFPVRRP